MKRTCSVFSFLLIAVFLYGQYDPKENFYDAEFFFAEEDYEEALYSFTQVYNDGFQENANINYRIGVCLLQIDGRKTEAIPYLVKAIGSISEKYREGSFKEVNAPIDALLYLGNAYRIDYQLDEAIKYYKQYLEYVGEDSYQSTYANLQIDACELTKKDMSNPVKYRTGTLGQINEVTVPVYNPTISGDNSTLSFMGKHKFYNAVYITSKHEGKWLAPRNITPTLQSDGNQDVLSLSHDGKALLLAWSDQFDSEIWISEYLRGRWSKSRPIGRPINSKYYESHACLTPDGNTIYFTSNRKESLGDMDIFKCTKNPDGEWSEIILLGENINTTLNEENPYVSPDGKRLYFSSQGHPGYGGFDIFYCDINPDGTYGKPVNIGYPLNTTDDDLAYSPKQISYDGYLTSYAKGDEGYVDLLRFEFIPDYAQPVDVAFEEIEEVVEEVQEVAEVIETPTITTDEPVKEVAEEVVEEVTEEVAEEPVQEVKVTEPEKPVEKYLIKPIFFDFDSYALNETAKKKLDDLLVVLNKYPELSLNIKGHTDAIGASEYNSTLSQNRAKAVMKYLAAKGIDESRLKIKALGETQHIAINRTADNKDAPKGRALNRRVQFEVLVPGGALIEVEMIKVPDNLKIK